MVSQKPTKRKDASVSVNNILLWCAVLAATTVAVLAYLNLNPPDKDSPDNDPPDTNPVPNNMDELVQKLTDDYKFAVNGSDIIAKTLKTSDFTLTNPEDTTKDVFNIVYKKVGGGDSPYVTAFDIGDVPLWIMGTVANARFMFDGKNDDVVMFVKTAPPSKSSSWSFTNGGEIETVKKG